MESWKPNKQKSVLSKRIKTKNCTFSLDSESQ